MRYRFVVRLLHPQPRRPLTTVLGPTSTTSTSSNPTTSSECASSFHTSGSGSANAAHPPVDSTRATSSAAATSAPSSVAIRPTAAATASSGNGSTGVDPTRYATPLAPAACASSSSPSTIQKRTVIFVSDHAFISK